MGHVGTYALHVTCPWRLSNVEGIVTGNADLWVTGDPNTTAAEIALDQKPGKALVDVNLRAWQEMHAAAPLRGESVRADHCGGSVLDLEHKFALEVFPEASHTAHNETEVWRLLQPNQSTAHFVVLNTGIEPPE